MLLKYFASTIIIWLSFITIAASLKDTIVDPDRQEWSAKCDTEEEAIDLRNESTHFSIPPKKKSYILQDCHEKSLTLITLSKSDKWKETEAVLEISNIKNLTIHTGDSYVKNLIIVNGTRVTINRVEVADYASPEDIPVDELAGLPATPIVVDANITHSNVSLGPMFSDLKDGYTFSSISVDQVDNLTVFVYTMGAPRDNLAEVETKLAISENYAYILVISLAVTGVLLAFVVFGLIPILYVYFKREAEYMINNYQRKPEHEWDPNRIWMRTPSVNSTRDLRRPASVSYPSVAEEAAWAFSAEQSQVPQRLSWIPQEHRI